MKNNFISSIWEFDNSEKKIQIHDTFRWYGKLPQFLVRKLINMYSKVDDVILANFAGSGTVLIESNILNRHVCVSDIHPISLLLNNVKQRAYVPNTSKFIQIIKTKDFQRDIYFDFKDSSKWFYKDSLIKLQGILEEINKIKTIREREFYLLCLSRIIRDGSKIDSRCVNHIVVDHQKTKINILERFEKSIGETKQALEEFKKIKTMKSMDVTYSDARKLSHVKDSSIDFIISHPPYANAVLYYNIYSLASTLLGYDYDEIRKSDMSKSNFQIYLDDLKSVVSENFRILKNEKFASLIIGDIRKNGEILTALPEIILYATSIGFKLQDIFIWRLVGKAGMNVARRGNHIDHNYILIFKKH
jgi:DNA modification methylase